MAEIYNRISVNLKNRLKNKYLSYPHVFKMKISLHKDASVKCFIRMKSDTIQCISVKNKPAQKTIKIKIKNAAIIKIIKWKPYKIKSVKHFVKYIFKPAKILLTLKNGKKYYVAHSHKHIFEQNYAFLAGDETKNVFSNFILYFNKKKNAFYGTGKSVSFHTKTPGKKCAKVYRILGYKYQKVKVNRRKHIPSFTENPGFKMKKSKTRDYFKRVKNRWRREKNQREKRRAALREKQRKARAKRRKK